MITLPLRPSNLLFNVGKSTVIDGNVYPGEMLLAGPFAQRSRAVYREGFNTFRIYLADELMKEAVAGVFGGSVPSHVELFDFRVIADNQLLHLMRAIASAGDDVATADPLFLDCVGLAIAVHLVHRHYTTAQGQPEKATSPLADWRLKRVYEYVESKLAHSISLGELASVADLSRMHFAAQFKAATGISPHTYILRCRILAAKSLLLDPALSIEDVALAVGFKTRPHFINVFRRFVGASPGRWRESMWAS